MYAVRDMFLKVLFSMGLHGNSQSSFTLNEYTYTYNKKGYQPLLMLPDSKIYAQNPQNP